MASLQYTKSSTIQTVTLGASYTSGSGSMTLTAGNGAYLPSSGDFWLSYNDGAGTIRIFKVTARSTDTLTVTAVTGEGAGDGNISSGETLRWALSVDALDQLRADISRYGTYGNLPATCKTGDRYLTSDSIYEFVATAPNTWTAFHKGEVITLPPTTSWSWDNQGSSTIDWTRGYGFLYTPASGSENIRLQYRTVSAPYTLTAKVKQSSRASNFNMTGLVLRESGSGKLIFWGMTHNSTHLLGSYYLPASTGSGSNRGPFIGHYWAEEIWLRVQDDNVNRILSYSMDGHTWTTYSSSARTTDLTADQIGFGCHNNNSWETNLMLISWSVT